MSQAEHPSDDDRIWAAFIELFGALPRQGPGDEASTLAVLELVPDRPEAPRILDAGCGSGSASSTLARALPQARIIAVDLQDELLARLRATAAEAGLGDRIETLRASMDALELRDLDLIWSEGAAYSVGLEQALRSWIPCVRPGGAVVFSEACWFVGPEQRPPALIEFWQREYPQILDEAGVAALIEGLGAYELRATRRLERGVWMSSYYEPLRRRCAALRPGASAIMLEVIARAEEEIAVFERWGDRYGYTFFVLTRRV